MTDEIVFEKLPFGANNAIKFVQLRSFIEHQLLTMTTRDWVLNQKDPTWQALCHYYATVIDLNVVANKAYAPLQPCIAAVSSGALIADFQYPFTWSRMTNSESLDPCMVFASITDCIHYYGEPQGGGDFPLPLTGFDQHLKNTKPGDTIHLTLKPNIDGQVLVMDDGQFISGIQFSNRLPDWSKNEVHAVLTRYVWRRWLRDSVLGIGLRNVVAPDGRVVVPTSAIRSFLENHKLSSEHCYLILSAVANGLWDPSLARFAIAKLLEVEAKFPQSIAAFVKVLPDAVAEQLPPALMAYRL